MQSLVIPLYATRQQAGIRQTLKVTFTPVPGSRLYAYLRAPTGTYVEGELLFMLGRQDGMQADRAELLARIEAAGLTLEELGPMQ